MLSESIVYHYQFHSFANTQCTLLFRFKVNITCILGENKQKLLGSASKRYI